MGGGYLYVRHLQNQVVELSQSAADARELADADLRQYQDLKAKADKMAKVISALETERANRQAALVKGRDEVARVASQPGGDAPVAPALRAALDVIKGIR